MNSINPGTVLNLRIAVLALLAITLSGCGSSRYTVLEPAKGPLTDYDILQINDFTSNLNDEDSVNLAGRFADQLHAAIMKERAERPGQSIFDEVVRATDATDSVLVLDGVVVSFEKGSRAKRYFIGFGSGKAYCTIHATFKNKVTGEEIVKTNFDGELSMSFFGGSAEEAVDEVVEAFIDYMADYFEEVELVKPAT